AGVACLGAILTAQTPPGGGFTAAQAARGRAAYLVNCAGCHLSDLAGRNEASPLAGPNFIAAWGTRTSTDLLAYIEASMPPNNPRSIARATGLDLVAFLLEANGAAPGDQPLSAAAAI